MAKKHINYNKNRITPECKLTKEKEEKETSRDFFGDFQEKMDNKFKQISQKIKNRKKH